MKNSLYLFFLLFLSCGITKEKKTIENSEVSSIYFLNFNIKKEAITNKIELISKKEVIGELKSKNQKFYVGENYLSFLIYKGSKIIDSVKIEHPLYKHFEYVDELGNFNAKDSIINEAEFFIRIKTTNETSQIRIIEKLADNPFIELNQIKLKP